MQRFLLAIVISAVVVADSPCDSAGSPPSSQAIYRNRAYGYGVRLPSGLAVVRAKPPNPDHGVGIVVSGLQGVWVDASYTDATSTSEEADRASEGCEVRDRRAATLGGQAGIALQFHCPPSGYGGGYFEFLILVVRAQGDRSAATYEIGVRSRDESGLSSGAALVRRLAAGFFFVG